MCVASYLFVEYDVITFLCRVDVNGLTIGWEKMHHIYQFWDRSEGFVH